MLRHAWAGIVLAWAGHQQPEWGYYRIQHRFGCRGHLGRCHMRMKSGNTVSGLSGWLVGTYGFRVSVWRIVFIHTHLAENTSY
ncbi:unnamed protein product, partial [Sphacelaria rigidula]